MLPRRYAAEVAFPPGRAFGCFSAVPGPSAGTPRLVGGRSGPSARPQRRCHRRQRCDSSNTTSCRSTGVLYHRPHVHRTCAGAPFVQFYAQQRTLKSGAVSRQLNAASTRAVQHPPRREVVPCHHPGTQRCHLPRRGQRLTFVGVKKHQTLGRRRILRSLDQPFRRSLRRVEV